MSEITCADCGSNNLVKNGHKITKAGKWQNYRCNDCGHSQKGELVKKWKSPAKKEGKSAEQGDVVK